MITNRIRPYRIQPPWLHWCVSPYGFLQVVFVTGDLGMPWHWRAANDPERPISEILDDERNRQIVRDISPRPLLP